MVALPQYEHSIARYRPYLIALPAPDPAPVLLLPAWAESLWDWDAVALAEVEDLRPNKLRDWEMWAELEAEWRDDQAAIREMMYPW